MTQVECAWLTMQAGMACADAGACTSSLATYLHACMAGTHPV